MTIKKQEVVANGIVINSKPYKDSDALVTIFTKEYGKMTLVAKGVKKIKSKNASAVQTITLSEFTFIPRVGLSTLIKATPTNFFRYIKEDIILETYASYMMEFVLKNEEDNHPSSIIYDTLLYSLECLENGYNYKLVYLLYNAFILKVVVSPLQVDGCCYCGKADQIVGISYSGGGFVCLDCIGEYDQRKDKDVLKAFRHINKYQIKDIDKINIEENILDELIEIMDYFIEEYTGILFKTKKFIKQLSKL